jgi:DNA-binding SARP family transcriptional activator
MAALPAVQLLCLGPPAAAVGGRAPAPEVLWTKHFALLVYLALSPGRRRTREHLMGLLWGESAQESARRSLNTALNLLRDHLGKQRLQNDGVAVVLNGDGLDVDALRVEAAALTAPADVDALIRGAFLEGFHVDNAPDFEDWMARERQRFAELHPRVLVGAGQAAMTEGGYAAAADYARRALELAPHSEPAMDLRARALARRDDRTGALTEFREWAARLERETGERPSAGLLAVMERIRKQTPARAPVPGPAAVDAPLVGRADVHRQVFQTAAEGISAGPRTIFIAAAPGMGRTRLLEECLKAGALEGARHARVRPLESDHDARWSALRNLVRAGLTDAPGLAAAPADALAVLAGLVPELAQRFPARDARDVADVVGALAAVLAAIAEETPLVLALDDAHWADGPSLAALAAATAAIERAPLLLVVTAALGVGEPPRELQRLRAAVGRDLKGVTVTLEPLADEDVRALVTRLAARCKTDVARDRLTRRLVVDTGGNPLFAVTMLGALAQAPNPDEWPPIDATNYAPLPVPLPALVHTAVILRIGELAPGEQNVLGAASLGGPGIDVDLVAALVERPRDDVERALPAFERRRLVVFEGSRYVFAARLVRDVARAECLTRGERRRLEQRAVAVLANRPDLESRVLRAELLARVDPTTAALSFVLDVVEEAAAAGASQVARRAWGAANLIGARTAADRARLEAVRARL